MKLPTQRGITPPVPGQEKEEPELRNEDDIPSDNHADAAEEDERTERPSRER